MGTFGSSMAGSMAGSMIGNTLFGGGGGAPAPAAVEAAPAPAGYTPAPPMGPTCAMESRHFLECMSQANDDMNYCRQYYDAFKMCSCARAHSSRPTLVARPVPTTAAWHHRCSVSPLPVPCSAIADDAVSAALPGAFPPGRGPPPLVSPRRTRRETDSWCATGTPTRLHAPSPEEAARAGFSR